MSRQILVFVLMAFLISRGVSKLFNYYGRNNLRGNEIAFRAYVDMDTSDIDRYFGLKEGTFNPSVHAIVCKLPFKDDMLMKPRYVPVSYYLEEINCNEKYDERYFLKYFKADLKGDDVELAVIYKSRASMIDITGRNEVASVPFKFDYRYGKINRIVFRWRVRVSIVPLNKIVYAAYR